MNGGAISQGTLGSFSPSLSLARAHSAERGALTVREKFGVSHSIAYSVQG